MHLSLSSFNIVCCVNKLGFDKDLFQISPEDGLRPKEIYSHPHGCIKLILVVLVAETCDEWCGHLRLRVLSQKVSD